MIVEVTLCDEISVVIDNDTVLYNKIVTAWSKTRACHNLNFREWVEFHRGRVVEPHLGNIEFDGERDYLVFVIKYL